MGLTTPALYRYFDNRDALVADLVIDAYDEMGKTMEQALKLHGHLPQAFVGEGDFYTMEC